MTGPVSVFTVPYCADEEMRSKIFSEAIFPSVLELRKSLAEICQPYPGIEPRVLVEFLGPDDKPELEAEL
jgi:hypothetical protein